MRNATVEGYEIKVLCDGHLQPVAGVLTELLSDGGYRVAAIEPGPFDTLEEVTTALRALWPLQQTLL